MGAPYLKAAPIPVKPKKSWRGLEKKIFEYICEFSSVNGGVPPTIRMINKEFGVGSTSVVNIYLQKLFQQGKLVRVEGTQIYRVVGAEWRPPDEEKQ